MPIPGYRHLRPRTCRWSPALLRSAFRCWRPSSLDSRDRAFGGVEPVQLVNLVDGRRDRCDTMAGGRGDELARLPKLTDPRGRELFATDRDKDLHEVAVELHRLAGISAELLVEPQR